MATDTKREAFEAWASNPPEAWDGPYDLLRKDDGYVWSATQGAWEAWQASAHRSRAAERAERKLSRDRLKALRRLSDAVLLALHHLDKQIGPDKTIPHAASVKLGQIAGALDLVNDTVRFGALGVDFRKDDKAVAVKKLT